MPPHSPRFGLPLPAIRDLFPDLFYPQSIAAPQTFPPSATRGPLQYTVMNLPPALTLSHSQLPFPDRSTTRDHIIDTRDRLYTHAPFQHRVFPHPHVPPSIHEPQLGSDHSVDRMSIPHTPSGFIPRVITPDYGPRSRHNVEREIGPSGPHGEERTSFPVPLSPPTVSDTTGSPSQLTLEGKSIRARKKRHKCDLCGSYWERPSFLRIHMVSHTKVKGFVCSICRRGFGVKSSCTRHIRALHKDQSEGTWTQVEGRH